MVLFAVTLLGCCSNPLESSLMLVSRRVAMNSGKAQMTVQPQMRSGRVSVYKSLLLTFLSPVEVFKFFFNDPLVFLGGRLSRRAGRLKSCSTRPESERRRLWALPKCFARWETAAKNFHCVGKESYNSSDFAVTPWPCFLTEELGLCVLTHIFICFSPCRTWKLLQISVSLTGWLVS